MFVSDGSATSETAVIPDWKRASKKLPFDKCALARHVLLVRKQTCICHSVSQKQLLCLCLEDFPTWPPPKPSKSSVTYARWPTSAERTAHSAGEPITVSAKVLSQRHLNKSDLIYGWGWAQWITLRDVMCIKRWIKTAVAALLQIPARFCSPSASLQPHH